MDKTEIYQTWKKLYIPFLIGVIILIGGVLWYLFGSHQHHVYSIFLSLFGGLLAYTAGIKMYKFRRYLNDNKM